MTAESSESRHDAWDRPLPLRSDPVPPFPIAVLPAKLATFARELARFTETAPDLACANILAALAASVAGKVTIAPKPGYEEPLNIMCLVALPPGERKSAVFRRVFRPLELKEQELQKDAQRLMAEVGSRRDELKARLKAFERHLRTHDDPQTRDHIAEVRAQLKALQIGRASCRERVLVAV